MSKTDLISVERIEKAIYLVRGEKVMLDRDLAELCRVKPVTVCDRFAETSSQKRTNSTRSKGTSHADYLDRLTRRVY